MKKREVFLKVFPREKPNQFNNWIIPLLENDTHDAAAIHVGVNDLLSNVKLTNNVCKDITDIGLNNIGIFFILSLAYSPKVKPTSIQQLNGLVLDKCRRNGFKFADNRADSEINLWRDGIHVIEKGKRIVANNLINSLN